MTTLIIDGLNRNVLKKRSIVTLKWEDDPEKRLLAVLQFRARAGLAASFSAVGDACSQEPD
jgi:hypothetical protein